MSRLTTRIFAVACAGLLALTACSSTNNSASPSMASANSQPAGITLSDQWVKATDTPMTAVFGTIHNNTKKDFHIVSATSKVSDKVELHMTVDGTMKEAKDGFTIPAGGTHELAPGADHIMLMNLQKPIESGAEVSVTLKTSDGAVFTFTAPARTFAGGNEPYHSTTPSESPSHSH